MTRPPDVRTWRALWLSATAIWTVASGWMFVDWAASFGQPGGVLGIFPDWLSVAITFAIWIAPPVALYAIGRLVRLYFARQSVLQAGSN